MRILLIDDDKDFLSICKRIFQNINDSHTIITINDPREVMVDIAKEELNNFDMIISDFRMNAIDGVLINKFLKSKSISTPFVLISSFDFTEIKRQYAINICDYFVQKKLFLEEFCQNIVDIMSKIADQKENNIHRTNVVISETVNYMKQYS